MAHTEIEVEFDRSLLVQAGLDPIRTSLTGHLHASARSAAVMAELLPDELTPRQTEQAIRTFLWGNALFLGAGALQAHGRCMPACTLPARITVCTA